MNNKTGFDWLRIALAVRREHFIKHYQEKIDNAKEEHERFFYARMLDEEKKSL